MTRLWIPLLLCPLLLHAEDRVRLTREGRSFLVQNDSVSMALTPEGDRGYTEVVSAWREGWHEVLRSGSALRSEPFLFADGGPRRLRWSDAAVAESSAMLVTIRLTGVNGTHHASKSITLAAGSPFLRVLVEDRVEDLSEVTSFLSTYSFVPERKRNSDGFPDFVWTPQLRPDSDDVIADHTFRAPAIVLQKGSFGALMIPDVERIIPWRSIETAADLQVATANAPFLSYGAMNWRQRSHVFYTHSDKMTTQFYDSRFWYGYFLRVTAAAPPGEMYRQAARFHWDTWGRSNLQRGDGPQAIPFAAIERKAWLEFFPSVALDTVVNGRPVTLLRQGRLAWSNKLPSAADTDTWFTVWFNALRTAYGGLLYARREKNAPLARRAERVLNLALAAPRPEGLAPSVFYLDSAGGHWVGDQGWGGIDHGKNYSTFANAWTGVWLLRWAEVLPARREEILRECRRLGDYLVRLQQPAGVIPSWIDPTSGRPVDSLRDVNAETAGSALFLVDLYRVTRTAAYLRAAEAAMDFLDRKVVPANRWFDHETFFSCSRKPLGFFDEFTRQYPQNTLSLHQAAEASAALYRVTGNRRSLERGRALLDYLSLYQQVWSPPWLSRPLFGGFGVQNTDGEWSDSRQGYFAVTYMDYYDLTGERELFERGVSALRAMFALFESPTSPRTGENYAHSARDRLGGVTGLHWGTGSSAVSVGLLLARYGDAYVDVDGGWGCGIDGCRFTRVNVERDTIRCDLADNVATPRTVRVRFDRMSRTGYAVEVNGLPRGRMSDQQLRAGIPVQLGAP